MKTYSTRRHQTRTFIILIIIFSVIAYEGYEVAKRFKYWYCYKQQLVLYKNEIDKLRKEHESLEEEAYKLQHSKLEQEKVAREMGFVKPGEIVFKFVPKKASEQEQ